MWPSFSLCACRILKIKSCLRRPLARGRSRARAILVSSLIFFSFNSAIVIFTYGVLDWIKGGYARDSEAGMLFPSGFFPRTRQPDWPGGDKGNSIMRPGAVVLQLSPGTRPVPPLVRPRCRHGQTHLSSCLECGFPAGQTSLSLIIHPSTQD